MNRNVFGSDLSSVYIEILAKYLAIAFFYSGEIRG